MIIHVVQMLIYSYIHIDTVGWYGGTQQHHPPVSLRGGFGPPSGMYSHSSALATFHERPARDGRGGNHGRTKDYFPSKHEEFKEPNPGIHLYVVKWNVVFFAEAHSVAYALYLNSFSSTIEPWHRKRTIISAPHGL